MLGIQQVTFWGPMDADTEAFVAQKTTEIHACMNRTAEDIIAIGKALMAVKERLQEGQFYRWLEAEFEMSDWSAKTFMRVARKFGDRPEKISGLLPSVIYELAAKSMPDEIVEQVTTGQIPPSLPAIREAKAALLPPAPVQETPAPTYQPPVYRPAPVTPLYEPGTIALPPELDFIADLAEQAAPKELGLHFLELMGKINRLYEAINEFESLHEEEISAGLQRMSLDEQERHAILLRMVRNWANALEARMHRNPEKLFTVIHHEGE